MSIDVCWLDERGETLAEGPSLDLRLLDWFPGSAPCLSAIDPVGDTTFNQKQIQRLATELDAVLAATDRVPPSALVELRQFVSTTLGHVHTYLKFVGD